MTNGSMGLPIAGYTDPILTTLPCHYSITCMGDPVCELSRARGRTLPRHAKKAKVSIVL